MSRHLEILLTVSKLIASYENIRTFIIENLFVENL